MRRIGIALSMFFLAGCAHGPSTREVMNSWIGHSRNELIEAWGSPQEKMDNDRNGQIFIYYEETTYTKNPEPADTTPARGVLGAFAKGVAEGLREKRATTYTVKTNYRTVHVDSNGVIQRISWRE